MEDKVIPNDNGIRDNNRIMISNQALKRIQHSVQIPENPENV